MIEPHDKVAFHFDVDEINPGNPLLPHKGRTLQACYWSIAEFPVWLLRRKAGWFCIGLLRSTVALRLKGALSEFIKLILLVFFNSTNVPIPPQVPSSRNL